MIGLGRMGANMVRRLLRGGHECVVHDRGPEAMQALAAEGAVGSATLGEFLSMLPTPRAVWIMVPAAAVDELLQALLAAGLAGGDILIDGGNSHYSDDVRRAHDLTQHGIHYVDVGTSGGLWGLERGYCLMVGGDVSVVQRIEPLLATLAPGGSATSAGGSATSAGGSATSAGGSATAARGYLHVGVTGAGHFVKMVHNGIEYGLMAAYAEGFNVLHHASVEAAPRAVDAETAPLRKSTLPAYDFKLEEISELWRHGSVISSWLLDLIAAQLGHNPQLEEFSGHVADSGEGRWTVQAAIEAGVPVPVLSIALYERFSSRGESEFADRLLSAMRLGFGGHHETPAGAKIP